MATDCAWDVVSSPGRCVQGYCSKLDSALCESDAACSYDNGTQACVEKTCAQLDRCACNADTSCFWRAENSPGCLAVDYAACPVIDIVVLVSGSKQMAASFGRHPHGFYGLFGLLRSWVSILPLSGELAGTTTPVGKQGGVRLAMMQFAGVNKDSLNKGSAAVVHTTVVGTKGRLSGSAAELLDDVRWHELNYANTGNMLAAGMQRAGALLAASPQDGRAKAVFILTGSKVYDSDQLSTQLSLLDSVSAKIFAVVVRRQAVNTNLDRAAVSSIESVVSVPSANHVANVELDSLVTMGGPLTGICDKKGCMKKWCYLFALYAVILIIVGDRWWSFGQGKADEAPQDLPAEVQRKTPEEWEAEEKKLLEDLSFLQRTPAVDAALKQLNQDHAIKHAAAYPGGKIRPGTSREENVHLFFTTDCTHHSLWQSIALEHTWQKVGSKGALSRLVSGCIGDDGTLNRKHEALKRTGIEHDRLFVFFGPRIDAHAVPGPHGSKESYPPINRPATVHYWFSHVHPPETVLGLLDPDMIFLKPLVYEGVALGHPVGQHYDYLISEDWHKVFKDMTDWGNLVQWWLRYTVEARKLWGKWVAEMAGMSIGLAKLNLRSRLENDGMWDRSNQGLDRMKAVGLFSNSLEVLKPNRSKYRVPGDWPNGSQTPRGGTILDCHQDLLFEYPPLTYMLKHYAFDSDDRGWLLFFMAIPTAINEAHERGFTFIDTAGNEIKSDWDVIEPAEIQHINAFKKQ
eukprot:gene130-200_t